MVAKSSYQILLVHDGHRLRQLMSNFLVSAGYVVRTADDGLDAIGMFREELPDLIISDVNLPRMSGFELLAVVRRRFPQIPVIVVNGEADAMPEGVAADAYFHKEGFGLKQLLQTLSDLSGRIPLRTAAPPVDNKPVRANWDGSGHYILACQDCLRSFSIPSVPTMWSGEMSAVCVHCGGVVPFFTPDEHAPGPAWP